MNKKNVNAYITTAYDALKDSSMVENNKLTDNYKAQISAFKYLNILLWTCKAQICTFYNFLCFKRTFMCLIALFYWGLMIQ